MDLGTYIEYDGRPAVRFQRTYAHPVERLWAAITDPAELARWFPSAVAIELRAGGSVAFSGDPYAADTTGVVLTCDPPRRLAFTWNGDELHFDLEQAGDGRSRLTLVNVLQDRDAAARNASGWYVCLAELAKLVDGREVHGAHSEHTEPWEPTYRAHVRAGLPAGAAVPDIVAR